jgi:tetratricopeptide (TPR) repeat protein
MIFQNQIRNGFTVLMIIIGMVMISGDAFSQKSKKKNKGSTRTLSENERSQLMYTFMNANREKILGNLEQAAALFAQCIRIDGTNHASMFELAQIYLEQGKGSDALFFARSAATLNPENEWYQLLLADVYQRMRKYSDAADVYQKLIKKYPRKVEYYFELTEILVQDKKFTDAIKIYEKLETETGIIPDVSVQKQQLWLKLGKVDKAAEEMRRLIAKYPDEVRYYGMLAEMYMANGMKDKAMELYEKVQLLDPGNPFVHLSMAEYYRNLGEREKSFQELKKAFASPQLDIDTKVNILSSYYAIVQVHPDMMDQALELNKLMLDAHPGDSRAYSMYGDFLISAEKYEDARTQYRKAISFDSQKYLVWQQLILADSEMKEYEVMLKDSEEALKLFPNQPLLYLFEGIANSQLKKHENAITSFKTGVMLVVDNKPLEAQFYSNLGDTYHTIEKHTESDDAYEKALVIEPDNAIVLNNYSYYLSLRNFNLDKAEKMSAKSNKLEPNNSSFEDTYAWVLYRAGKYDSALKWIEKAFKNGGESSAVILEHYGDILFKLGKETEAHQYWQKATKTGAGSDFLQKKIADKKLYE